MIWRTEHAEALKAVFKALDCGNIRWMIMRNYEGLPEVNTSKDIDIAIPRQDWKGARDIIYRTLRERGFTKVLFTKFQSILCHTFYKFEEGDITALKIDIFACYEWRGAEYISFDKLYKESVVYNGMHVPGQVLDAVMLFLKPLLLGGVIKDKYRKTYMEVIPRNRSATEQILEGIVGRQEAEFLVDLVIRGEDHLLKDRYRTVRRKLWMHYFRKHPFLTLGRLIQHYWTESRRRIFSAKNNIYAVLGSDGVGKSTFLEGWKGLLVEHIPLEDHSIEIIHFRPNILPNIKKLILGKKFDVNKEDFNSPHRARPAGFFSSLIRITYYWLDYIIGVPMKNVMARYRQKYIIFDRYFHDFIVDPYRARIKLPYWIRRGFLAFVKKPAITFVLLADPQVIYDRKKELELKEIERQASCYLKLIDGKKVVRLDASKKPEDVASEAFQSFILRIGEDI